MSRVAKQPVQLPEGVELNLAADELQVKGPKGELRMPVNSEVEIKLDGDQATVGPRSGSRFAHAMSGTTRALINNMVKGVTDGFEKKLQLVGIGYRAQTQGKNLNLTLGFSHPVVYEVPAGIEVEIPSQNEIIVKGIDKQKVGQIAAEIRRYRPPEPYKGKGVRYDDERVVMKVAKKTA
jgi:large subunit ribosomal protein L6